MAKVDLRLEILDQARRLLTEESSLSAAESEDILKLLKVLIEATEGSPDPKESAEQARRLAADLIQNQTILLTLKQQADELDTLKKLSLNLTASLDLPTVLDAVVTEAMRLVKSARAAHIFLYLDDRLEFGAALNQDGSRNQPMAIPRQEGLTYKVARSGMEIVVEDMRRHALYKNAPPDWEGSIIGIPLKINNAVVGVMNLSKSTLGGFSNSELRLLGLLADQAAVAISNASLHKIVSEQAYSDSLTSLPNRRALDERLEEEVRKARRNGFPFAVIMMDLDGFKTINDHYGHSVGDQVLRSMFNHLATGLRATDFLARYGGDELTLILSHTDRASASVVSEKIIEKLEDFAFDLPDGRKIKVGLSDGIALYPLHATTTADLLRAADAALYRAKKHRRGSFMEARGFTGELTEPGL